ncbi:hypothetical protein ACA910_019621 [Epithemia clementina (nom. ined.)]
MTEQRLTKLKKAIANLERKNTLLTKSIDRNYAEQTALRDRYKCNQTRVTDILKAQSTQLQQQTQQFQDMSTREHNLTQQIERGFQETTKITMALLQVLGDFVVTEIRPGTQFDLSARLQDRLTTNTTTSALSTAPSASHTDTPQPMTTSPPRNEERKRTRSSPGHG